MWFVLFETNFLQMEQKPALVPWLGGVDPVDAAEPPEDEELPEGDPFAGGGGGRGGTT